MEKFMKVMSVALAVIAILFVCQFIWITYADSPDHSVADSVVYGQELDTGYAEVTKQPVDLQIPQHMYEESVQIMEQL